MASPLVCVDCTRCSDPSSGPVRGVDFSSMKSILGSCEARYRRRASNFFFWHTRPRLTYGINVVAGMNVYRYTTPLKDTLTKMMSGTLSFDAFPSHLPIPEEVLIWSTDSIAYHVCPVA